MRDECLHAWGIPFKGEIEPPTDLPVDGSRSALVSLGHLIRVWRVAHFRVAVVAVAIIISAAGLLALAIAFPVADQIIGILLATACFIPGVLLLKRAVNGWRILRRLEQISASLAEIEQTPV